MNVYLDFSDVEKKPPAIEVRLSDIRPTDSLVLLPDGTDFCDAWEGTLITTVVTQRGQNSDQHAELVGQVRSAVAQLQMQDLDLPYHFVQRILLGVSPRGTDQETMLDKTEVHHSIQIGIKREAWTANPHPSLQQLLSFEAAFEPVVVKLLQS